MSKDEFAAVVKELSETFKFGKALSEVETAGYAVRLRDLEYEKVKQALVEIFAKPSLKRNPSASLPSPEDIQNVVCPKQAIEQTYYRVQNSDSKKDDDPAFFPLFLYVCRVLSFTADPVTPEQHAEKIAELVAATRKTPEYIADVLQGGIDEMRKTAAGSEKRLFLENVLYEFLALVDRVRSGEQELKKVV